MTLRAFFPADTDDSSKAAYKEFEGLECWFVIFQTQRGWKKACNSKLYLTAEDAHRECRARNHNDARDGPQYQVRCVVFPYIEEQP